VDEKKALQFVVFPTPNRLSGKMQSKEALNRIFTSESSLPSTMVPLLDDKARSLLHPCFTIQA
jgi:hypothetical protein